MHLPRAALKRVPLSRPLQPLLEEASLLNDAIGRVPFRFAPRRRWQARSVQRQRRGNP